MSPWYSRGLHYETQPGISRMKKCGRDHNIRMDETLERLIVQGGGVTNEDCSECGTTLLVMWYGMDRWEMREFAPRAKERE